MFTYKTLEGRALLDIEDTVYVDSYDFQYVLKGEDYFNPRVKKFYERKRAIVFDMELHTMFCKGKLSMFLDPDFDTTFLKSEKKS
jgi:hypothetical protein